MDPLSSKAKRQMASSTSKASSKGSSRKARSKKSKKASGRSQNAGQPTGPSSGRSKRGSSRVEDEDEEEAHTRSKTKRTKSGGDESAMAGIGTKIAGYTVGALHAIDIGLGISLLVYGGMVHVASVTGAAVAYGLLLFLGAVAGAIGYYSGSCNRRGLVVSSIAGGLTCAVDICLFIAVVAAWDTFIKFLKDNHEALMLSEGSVDTINGLKILFAAIFILLAGLEGHRAMAMWGLKDSMPDSGSRVSPLSASKDKSSCCDGFLSMFGIAKRKKTDDFVMFDDNASMESSLLWSKDGAMPSSDDYLEFVPEHERGLASFTSKVALPMPPEDRVDY